jgi:DNA-binding NarL/FixJ family response regulator
LFRRLPQVLEQRTSIWLHATGEGSIQDESMIRVFLADAKPEERSALRLMLQDLQMDVVGEAVDWMTVPATAPVTNPDMVLMDLDLLPGNPTAALRELRAACSHSIVIILIGQPNAVQKATFSAGADGFISNGDCPEHVAEHLVAASKKKSNERIGG